MEQIFGDAEVLWISRFDYEKHWYLKTHVHNDFYQLIYLIGGECVLRLDGEEVNVQAPQVLFLSPRTEHGIHRVVSPNLSTLDMKFNIHNRDLARASEKVPHLFSPINDEVRNLLELIREQGVVKDHWYQEVCRLFLGMLLLTLFRWHGNKESGAPEQLPVFHRRERTNVKPLTAQILDYLEDACSGPMEAKDLERRFHYSYRYLSGIFKQDMRRTPMAYREQLRIAKSKELMSYTGFELKEICGMAGYQDIHQFTKSFKKEEGVPPGQWREELQQCIRQDVCIQPDFKNTLYVEKESD